MADVSTALAVVACASVARKADMPTAPAVVATASKANVLATLMTFPIVDCICSSSALDRMDRQFGNRVPVGRHTTALLSAACVPAASAVELLRRFSWHRGEGSQSHERLRARCQPAKPWRQRSDTAPQRDCDGQAVSVRVRLQMDRLLPPEGDARVRLPKRNTREFDPREVGSVTDVVQIENVSVVAAGLVVPHVAAEAPVLFGPRHDSAAEVPSESRPADVSVRERAEVRSLASGQP